MLVTGYAHLLVLESEAKSGLRSSLYATVSETSGLVHPTSLGVFEG
jgi:hypothetical protein